MEGTKVTCIYNKLARLVVSDAVAVSIWHKNIPRKLEM